MIKMKMALIKNVSSTNTNLFKCYSDVAEFDLVTFRDEFYHDTVTPTFQLNFIHLNFNLNSY